MTGFSRSNRKRYQGAGMVRKYRDRHGLFPAEERILAEIAPTVRNRPVLDLGVGAGRTAPHLSALGGSYLGLDYAPRMIEAARRAYPGLHFETGDARDLGTLPTDHFALVFFSFNGIDYIDPAGRLQALGEIRRVLAPGGHFVFSSHNAAFTEPLPWAPSRFVPTKNPLRTLVRLGHYLTGCLHYLALRPQLREGGDWSLRVVGERNFSVVAYHIRPAAQIAELETAGFRVSGLYTFPGEPIPAEAVSTGPDDPPPWIYYVARKESGSGGFPGRGV